MPAFSVGTRVELVGLVSASQHNGKHGIVRKVFASKERRKVVLINDHDITLSVRVANLTLSPLPATRRRKRRLAAMARGREVQPPWPDEPQVDKVVEICAGDGYSLAVSARGAVFSWGFNEVQPETPGRLGHGGFCNARSGPSPILALAGKRVVAVMPGTMVGLALTASSEVYTWGSADIMSPHGHPDEKAEAGESGTRHGNFKLRLVPQEVEALKGKEIVEVCDNAFGHGLVVTQSGEVYSWGMTGFGRLGHGPLFRVQKVPTPKRIEALVGKRVVEVSSAGAFSVALTASGEVYSWGINRKGELGLGFCCDDGVNVPILITPLNGKEVVSVSCGVNQMLALTMSGEIFSWGNESGALGHGDDEVNGHVPKLVQGLRGKEVVDISSGRSHVLVLTAGGEVYSWGNGDRGRLGHGDTENQNLPKLVQALVDKGVSGVSAGNLHSLAVTASGEVYEWGQIFSPQIVYEAVLKPVLRDELESGAGLNRMLVVTAEQYNAVCPICLEVPRLPIGHRACGKLFCTACFSKWFLQQNKRSCPNCRGIVDFSDKTIVDFFTPYPKPGECDGWVEKFWADQASVSKETLDEKK